MQIDDNAEWLEPDGLGGFASGTTSGIRTRRYHALLLTAATPPTGRMVLVNGAEAWLDTSAGSFALSSERYAPGVTHPDGTSRIVAFEREPWPSWELETPDGTRIRHEVVVQRGSPCAVLTWTVLRAPGPLTLRVRPFLSGRDYHALHHENAAFRFEPQMVSAGDGGTARGAVTVRFAPYAGVPGVEIRVNGEYRHSPVWYRNFFYQAEGDRGLDDTEDLASPGEFVCALAAPGDTAACIMRACRDDAAAPEERVPVAAAWPFTLTGSFKMTGNPMLRMLRSGMARWSLALQDG